jgi:hypothetical protein
VVVLWVVLEDLGLLSVLEIPDEIVHSELLPPFFVGNKPIAQCISAHQIFPLGTAGCSVQCCEYEEALHLLAQLDIEFPSSQKSE